MKNAFDNALGALGGVDSLFGEQGAEFSNVPLDMIIVKTQIRTVFEDGPLNELAESIRQQGVLQPILLRPAGDDYELVAGERRFRASKQIGLASIPAFIKTMTDEEAEHAQLIENIHRENLQLIDEATKLKRDLDALGGDREALCAKINKSISWVSKRLGVLDLPPETKKLIEQNVTSDVEVISSVKQVEKADPAAAKQLVKELASDKNKTNARQKADAVKQAVKPSKKGVEKKQSSGSGVMATPKDRSNEAPSPVEIHSGNEFPIQPSELSGIWSDLEKGKKTPMEILEALKSDKKLEISDWLRSFYKIGTKTSVLEHLVFQGIKAGQFGTTGAEAFALGALLQGANELQSFDIVGIFACAMRGGDIK